MIAIVGANGMLGQAICATLACEGMPHEPLSKSEFDIARFDPSQVRPHWRWVINCAAYTKVDQAETEKALAREVNATGPGRLAEATAQIGARLVHFSTDYVFSRRTKRPIPETARCNPPNFYGQSKREGEVLVMQNGYEPLVVRTSWLYGVGGPCFPKTMLRLGQSRRELRVVADQWGRPTHSADLARATVRMIRQNMPSGIFHCCGPQVMHWADFAELCLQSYQEVVDRNFVVPKITQIATSEYPTPAKRPHFSVLSTKRLEAAGILPMPEVHTSLLEFWKDCNGRSQFA